MTDPLFHIHQKEKITLKVTGKIAQCKCAFIKQLKF